jgi:hypothetical protein
MRFTKAAYQRRMREEAKARAADYHAVMGRDGGEPRRLAGDERRDAVYTLVAASPLDHYKWFDLEEVKGLALALQRAGDWRLDGRLNHRVIEVYQGSRTDNETMRLVARFQEIE